MSNVIDAMEQAITIIGYLQADCGGSKLADEAVQSLQKAIEDEQAQGASVVIEHAKCSNCAGVESPGFYTGCMVKDGHCKDTGWSCDGEGNLARVTRAAKPPSCAPDEDSDESPTIFCECANCAAGFPCLNSTTDTDPPTEL